MNNSVRAANDEQRQGNVNNLVERRGSAVLLLSMRASVICCFSGKIQSGRESGGPLRSARNWLLMSVLRSDGSE